MNKYFKVTLAIVKNNLIREMEYRVNFFVWLFIQILWVSLQIFIVQILFQHTNNILGWTKPEIFLLIGMFRIIRGIFDFFVYANLTYLPEDINSGNLDYTLTKPVSTLYLSSFRKHQYDQIGTFFSGIGFVVYAGPTVNIIVFGILILCGFLAFYSLILMVSTLSFFLTKLRAIGSIHDIVNTILRYPVDMLLGNRSGMNLLLLPLTIIATIPAKIVLGKTSPTVLVVEIISVILFFLLAICFWKYALKRYSSASS